MLPVCHICSVPVCQHIVSAIGRLKWFEVLQCGCEIFDELMDRRGHGALTRAICRVYVYDGAWSYLHQMNLTFVDATWGSNAGTEVTRKRP